jgi:glycerol kinase
MDVLLQLQADQLGVPVARPKLQETTAVGAAYLAGLAEGVWDGLDGITANWQLDAEFTPVEDRTFVELAYTGWRRAVERSLRWDAPR